VSLFTQENILPPGTRGIPVERSLSVSIPPYYQREFGHYPFFFTIPDLLQHEKETASLLIWERKTGILIRISLLEEGVSPWRKALFNPIHRLVREARV